ncbi:ABC transporter substrate-binding protein [Marinobacterium sediminicola]|uniref:Amino acid/amide ABC transporter substrate-binding protein, HAAT family (TC 3.A.1.4.-) n=1 Tax=Marinobacterium sediminicola TaxID=518898 RepID=A0ABY1RXE9_9GAMM|nr:ABC transporter substrate-binding protein [Marinobacterium sediminicola]ULG67752.1 ABC transporter substrate-binding protein [Marinobacterium sediminicola]SMR71601.1 amino acid/amide ABC transporter substrate-binding protein, HAAT family (TC 3.A.1.4.-) [Marinobacterium sediminicola]
MNKLPRLLSAATLSIPLLASAATTPLEIEIGYIGFEPDHGPVLSNILPEPADAGLKGAELAINDSNTTGRFLKQHYTLHARSTDQPDQIVPMTQALYDQGIRLMVLNLTREQLVAVEAELPDDVLLINAGSQDNALRTEQCIPGMLHSMPSRAMLTDALAQWLMTKRWKRWLLLEGQTPEDRAYADSVARSAQRMGAVIVERKQWSFDTDLRRTAQKELPPFTQTDEYDVVVVADERGDFGEYVPFNTWYPRPVVGTQGMSPVVWHRVVEAWGAAQLQSRFEKLADRWMNGRDYASWAGVRTLAEAVTQTGETDPAALKQFILSDKFQLGAFKGRKLTYRDWSGQLRQPIPLTHPRALVSQSPQAGYLHPVTDLDTLGFDQRESQCSVKGDS